MKENKRLLNHKPKIKFIEDVLCPYNNTKDNMIVDVKLKDSHTTIYINGHYIEVPYKNLNSEVE